MKDLNIPDRVNGKIIATLTAVQKDLPEALKRLTKFLLSDPNHASSLSVIDMARSANVGEATVVRLAKTLNFPGYKEFQIELVKELAVTSQQAVEEQILDSNISDDDDCIIMAKKIKMAMSRAISENIRAIDQVVLLKVADAIFKARKVYIIGVGNSCLTALYLKNKLCRIGIEAFCEPMTHFMYTALAMLGPSDVVIAVSQKGGSYETNKAFSIGKETGALCVAITNNPVSKLSAMSDYLLINGNEEGMLQGDSAATISAQLHICELLYTIVVSFNRAKAAKTKQLTLKALSQLSEGLTMDGKVKSRRKSKSSDDEE